MPWVLYERYGDTGILRRQYGSMRAWVEAELGRADDRLLWLHGGQIGDHLDPTAPAERPTDAKTSPAIVACAYLARSLRIMADTASVLGEDADAARFADAARTARESFQSMFVTPGGRMVSDAPTAYALALNFDLVLDPQLRGALGDRLAELVRENGYRIGTGFIGTPELLDALLATGHVATAGRLLTQTQPPSWLYPVTMGATTVWERWDSLLPDGRINPGEMTSFNHYALGSVVDTLHRRIAGLAPDAPGYARLAVAPQPLPGLTSASSSLETPYGRAEVGWTLHDGRFDLTVKVPPNTTAEIRLPGATDAIDAGAGTHRFSTNLPAENSRRGPVGLQTTDLADLIDDAEALAAVLVTLDSIAPDRAAALRTGTQWKRGSFLPEVLMFSGPAVLQAVDDTLSDLSRRRVAR